MAPVVALVAGREDPCNGGSFASSLNTGST